MNLTQDIDPFNNTRYISNDCCTTHCFCFLISDTHENKKHQITGTLMACFFTAGIQTGFAQK